MSRDLNLFNSDVAQVQHKTAENFGSGRLVAPSLVLTARHVLEDRKGRLIGEDGWQIRLESENPDNGDRGKQKWIWRDAVVAWQKPAIDIALLRVTGYTTRPHLQVDFCGIGSAAIDAALPGFPLATREGRRQPLYRARGDLTEHTQSAPYRLGVTWQDAPTTAQKWAGMSGAAVTVYCDPLPPRLPIFGVAMQVDPANFTPGMIEVERIDKALRDTDFRDKLQRAIGREPVVPATPIPYPRPRPAPLIAIPPAQRKCLLDILYTFDRNDEADFVAVKAEKDPAPIEIVVCGLVDDAHHLFAERLRREALAAGGVAEIDLPQLEWPGGQVSERLYIAIRRLSEALTEDEKSATTPAGIRAALKAGTRRFVRLEIVGSDFSADDTRALIEWRKLWHDAAQGEALPPSGVIYAIKGVSEPSEMSDPLKKALDAINGRPSPHRIKLPLCQDRMLERWPSHLAMRRRGSKDTRPVKAAEALHRTLMNQDAWKEFRLRNLEVLLSEIA